MKLIGKFGLACLLSSQMAQATLNQGAVSQSFNFDGVLTDASGNPITAGATLRLQLINPAGNCLIYEEQQIVGASTDGAFSVKIGSQTGSSKRTMYDSGYEWPRLFQNNIAFPSNTYCPGGWTPLAGDERLLRVYVNGTQLSPNFSLSAVPSASVAETLQGKRPTDLINTRVDGSTALSQTNVEDIFSTTNYPALANLVAGTSNLYMSANPTAAVSFGNQVLSSVGAPVAITDATNKGYVDARLAGKSLDASGVSAGVGTGKVLAWDGAQNKWVAQTLSASDATKLPLTGGSLTGALDMGGNALAAVGYISMANQRYLRLGNYTTSEESTLTGGLNSANRGTTWYNSSTDTMKFWNGSTALSLGVSGGTISTTQLLGSNPGVNRLVMTDSTTGVNLAPKDCANGEVLAFITGTGWQCSTPALSPWTTAASDVYYNMGKVGIGTATPARLLSVNGAMRVTPGTLPGSPAAGDLAFDSADSNKLKFHNGASWQTVGTGTGSGDFKADGSVTMTGQVVGTAGAAAAPSFTFSSDTATGMYRSGAGTIALTHAGTPGWLFTATGMQNFAGNGPTLIANTGNASTPNYSFTQDPNTGIFSGGSDILSFSTGGVGRMAIVANGSVAIGSAAPTTGAILDLQGTGSTGSSLLIPRDTTANRPSSPVAGMVRYNSTTAKIEAYENTAWVNYASSGMVAYATNAVTSVGLGAQNFIANATGTYNTAIGKNAMSSATVSGNGNTAVGGNALGYLTTGASNTAIGAYAGLNLTVGSNNTLIGLQAGQNITTPSNNIVIGYNSASTLATGAGNIVIGSNLDVPSASTQNTLNIGGVLYGDLSNKYIGIGMQSPASPLHIMSGDTTTAPARISQHSASGTAQIAFARARGTPASPGAVLNGDILGGMSLSGYGSGFGAPSAEIRVSATENYSASTKGAQMVFATTANGTTTMVDRLIITPDGNVGIGTSSPISTLHVAGGFTLGSAGSPLTETLACSANNPTAMTSITNSAGSMFQVTCAGVTALHIIHCTPSTAPTLQTISWAAYFFSTNTIGVQVTNTYSTAGGFSANTVWRCIATK